MAADPVDDPLVAASRVGVADRGISLGAQRGGTVGEVAAQHGEAEGAEVVHLGGGEHGFLLRTVTGTVRDDPSRQEEPGRVPPAVGHGQRRKVSGFK